MGGWDEKPRLERRKRRGGGDFNPHVYLSGGKSVQYSIDTATMALNLQASTQGIPIFLRKLGK